MMALTDEQRAEALNACEEFASQYKWPYGPGFTKEVLYAPHDRKCIDVSGLKTGNVSLDPTFIQLRRNRFIGVIVENLPAK